MKNIGAAILVSRIAQSLLRRQRLRVSPTGGRHGAEKDERSSN